MKRSQVPSAIAWSTTLALATIDPLKNKALTNRGSTSAPDALPPRPHRCRPHFTQQHHAPRQKGHLRTPFHDSGLTSWPCACCLL
ncbi:hypothetical protein BC830DRAFT_1143247 [Chytriomyces sp. MP71]|nr:hypothetical protein BC830DRAFT_1143247 [Chytriomyces sp. MP71]